MEILQLALQRPSMAILDETDSGLDIDALRVVANGVNAVAGPDMGVLIITHYQRILHLVQPSHVHVMYQGRIVREGGPELVDALEAKGYGWITDEIEAAADDRRSPRTPRSLDGGRARSSRFCEPARSTGGRVAYLDSAATSQTPEPVIDAMTVVLHAHARVDPPRRVPARGRGDRAVRGRAGADRLVAGLDGGGDDLHRERHRGDQPGRLHLGPRRTCSAAISWC